MILLHFFRREVQVNYTLLLSLLFCSGLANASLLIIINLSADYVLNYQVSFVLLLSYIIALLVYLFAQQYTLDTAIAGVETAMAAMKIRLLDKIRHKNIAFIEQYPQVSDFAPLVRDSNLLAQGTTQFILAIQNAIVVIVACAYLAFLSAITFYLLVLSLLVIWPFYQANVRKSRHFLKKSARKERYFLRRLQSMMRGFAQLKLDHTEAAGLAADAEVANQESSQARITFNTYMVENIVFSNAVFYSFMLIVVFIFPLFMQEHEIFLYHIISTLLFIMGPLLMLVVVVPMLARTTQNLQSLYALENRLDKVTELEGGSGEPEPDPAPQAKLVFSSIRLAGLAFEYKNQLNTRLFLAGPYHLVLRPSEIVFIVGQNGSGKSTFLKLLSGLYLSETGKRYLNEQRVTTQQLAHYRQLFSAVFADFYLFDQLYGLSTAQVAEVNFWLQAMQLESVTSFDGKRFTQTALSTGLRKRLAFVAAMAKQRPICILDEVAADQEPAFRHHFYETILPLMQQRGHTVLLVSHDPDYYHCADRVIRLVDGKIAEDKRQS